MAKFLLSEYAVLQTRNLDLVHSYINPLNQKFL